MKIFGFTICEIINLVYGYLFTARILRSGKLLLYNFGNRCCSMPATSNRWNNSDIHQTIVVILLLGDISFDADTTPGGE
jgi:hypothetical protein